MSRFSFFFGLLGTSLVLGCASSPDKLPTTYVSPNKFQSYDCNQVTAEMDHVSHRTAELYGSLKKKADDDAAQMGVGLVLFWPALFFLEGGDGPEAVEYANLKGEYEALRTAAVHKQCDSDRLPPSPEEIVAAAADQEKLQKENAGRGQEAFVH